MKYAFAILLLFNLLTGSALADKHLISKQQAISIAQQNHPGRVLSVKQKNDHYRIKIIDKQGNVRMVRVDARKDKKNRD